MPDIKMDEIIYPQDTRDCDGDIGGIVIDAPQGHANVTYKDRNDNGHNTRIDAVDGYGFVPCPLYEVINHGPAVIRVCYQ